MTDSPKERIEKLTRSILTRIEKSKRSMSDTKELTNQDIALVMAQYAIQHQSTMSDDDRDKLDEMMSRLDQQHMDIINMYFWCGKTYEQIAETYNRPGERTWVSRKLQEAYKIMREK